MRMTQLPNNLMTLSVRHQRNQSVYHCNQSIYLRHHRAGAKCVSCKIKICEFNGFYLNTNVINYGVNDETKNSR